MCAIFGFIGFRDDKLLQDMGQCLAHRGPDDQNEFTNDRVSLGYRRLSVIDVAKSFQPLYNEDKSIVLLFNGEIYNFSDLRSKLKSHKFKTDGDGEIIIHWYEKYGPAGFAKLNGMFAISLYDIKKQKIYLIRDHFGIKPLYYFIFKHQLIYASEIKAILKKIIPQPNDQVIQKYLLTRNHDDTEETFFKNIKRVPSASYLEWDLKTNKYQIKKFWRLRYSDHVQNLASREELLTKRFKDLFLDSVKLRQISEVPVGTALSGGLDSSAIVCITPNLKTFSAVFPYQINNEEKYIDEVVQKTGVTAFKVYPKVNEFWQEIEKLIYHQDEPMISTGPYAQWKVMEKAHAEGIKVIIDGQGADEMLAGYIPYYFAYFKELLKSKKFSVLLKEVILSFDILWPLIKEGFKKKVKAESLFTFAGLNPATHPAVQDATLLERLKKDFFKNSLPALLRYEDKNSMGFSIESRVPVLDYRLVEFVFSLPSNFIIRNGWNKWLMRQALKDLLPAKIVNRRWKVGFSTPEVSWLRHSADKIREIFNSPSFNARPYFNHAKIREEFEKFVRGEIDDSMVFWRIINLELWLKIFIDK